MITYSCDGDQFFGNYKCPNKEINEVPEKWMIIDAKSIINKLDNAKLNSMGNGTLHFCSKQCLNNFLFKNMPDYKELSIYFSIFKSGARTENKAIEEVELKKRFLEYVKGFTYYDEMIGYSNYFIESLKCL